MCVCQNWEATLQHLWLEYIRGKKTKNCERKLVLQAEPKNNKTLFTFHCGWLDLTWREPKKNWFWNEMKWNEMTGNKSRWNFFSWKTILTLSKKKKNSVESSKTKWNESLCFVNTETLKPNLCFMRKRFFFKWLFLSRRKVFTTDHNSILLNIGKRRNTKDGPLFFPKDY